MKLYQWIAQKLENKNSLDPVVKHKATCDLEALEKFLPSGSGFDSGTTIYGSNRNRIVLRTGFHHMDEHGSYCGWSYHSVIITPSLINGIDIHITGKDVRDIKDYMYSVMETTLNHEMKSEYVGKGIDGYLKFTW